MPVARARRAALLAVLLALPAGCRLFPAAAPERTHFYTLSLPVPSAGTRGSRQLAIGLGPITFPTYLDRSEIVVRKDDERIEPASGDRWAGPLRAQFERSLALRLMTALGTDDVVIFPWWPGRRRDAVIQLSVLAFETDASGVARLDALWTMKGGEGKEVLDSGTVSLREPVSPGGTEQGVAALDRTVEQLADTIAIGVRRAIR